MNSARNRAKLNDYTERCIISFVDEYAHTRNRTDVLNRNEFSCAEEINLNSLGIEHSSCINQKKVEQLIGARITAKKDTKMEQISLFE